MTTFNELEKTIVDAITAYERQQKCRVESITLHRANFESENPAKSCSRIAGISLQVSVEKVYYE